MGPKAVLKLAAVIVVAAAALLYAGDFAWFEYRVLKPKPNDPFETLTVYYASDVKGGKVEVFEVPQLQTCIHSIFPHRGYRPCWRFSRSGVERISMHLERLMDRNYFAGGGAEGGKGRVLGADAERAIERAPLFPTERTAKK